MLVLIMYVVIQYVCTYVCIYEYEIFCIIQSANCALSNCGFSFPFGLVLSNDCYYFMLHRLLCTTEIIFYNVVVQLVL